jgi:tripartite motif-containing protein 71
MKVHKIKSSFRRLADPLHHRSMIVCIGALSALLLGLFAASAQANEATFTLAFGSKGSGAGQFGALGPAGSTFGEESDLWVADPSNTRIERFNANGEFLSQFTTVETPNDVGSLIGDSTFVSGPNAVRHYSPTGVLSEPTYGSAGSGPGEFNGACGIAVQGVSNLWVVDTGNDRVEKFAISGGKYLSQFGTKGSGNGQLLEPHGIALDSAGNLWVVDTGNNRVEEFNKEGGYLGQFGTKGSGTGQFSAPREIAIDSSGDIWVTDMGNNRVEEFNKEGKYLAQFGVKGPEAGKFNAPAGLTIDPSNNLWVSDAGNFRVQKWRTTE